MITLSTNNDTALRDDTPPHHLPPVDVLDGDHPGDDLLLRLLDRLFSDENLTSDLFPEELTDAYDLVTLDELLDGLSDLVLLVIPLDLDLLDEAFRGESGLRLASEKCQILDVIVGVAPLQRLVVHSQLVTPLDVKEHQVRQEPKHEEEEEAGE